MRMLWILLTCASATDPGSGAGSGTSAGPFVPGMLCANADLHGPSTDLLRGSHLKVLEMEWAPFATRDPDAEFGWVGYDIDLRTRERSSDLEPTATSRGSHASRDSLLSPFMCVCVQSRGWPIGWASRLRLPRAKPRRVGAPGRASILSRRFRRGSYKRRCGLGRVGVCESVCNDAAWEVGQMFG